VLAGTFVLTIVFDLAVAVEVGCDGLRFLHLRMGTLFKVETNEACTADARPWRACTDPVLSVPRRSWSGGRHGFVRHGPWCLECFGLSPWTLPAGCARATASPPWPRRGVRLVICAIRTNSRRT
jgi:hypothetical protein